MSESDAGIMFSQADASVGAGQVNTPNTQDSANSGSDPLSSPQRAALIGDPVPIVFGRRVGDIGGVLVSPAATEARFENNSANEVTASYHLVISEGEIDGTQVRDVFQQSCRVGTFTQAYDRRAGNWGPGNFITVQTGFEDSVPDCPIYCGTANGSYAGMTTASFINTIPDRVQPMGPADSCLHPWWHPCAALHRRHRRSQQQRRGPGAVPDAAQQPDP
jgi:hypothetical protein